LIAVERSEGPAPNPKRVAAGRRNRALRGPLTPEGREKLRQAALRNQPWQHSTGPRTPAGRAQSRINGKKGSQKGPLSVREVRAALADVRELIHQMREVRTKLLA
jgi:hypothetical protein